METLKNLVIFGKITQEEALEIISEVRDEIAEYQEVLYSDEDLRKGFIGNIEFLKHKYFIKINKDNLDKAIEKAVSMGAKKGNTSVWLDEIENGYDIIKFPYGGTNEIYISKSEYIDKNSEEIKLD